MASPDGAPGLDVLRYIRVLRRRKMLVGAVAAVVVVAAELITFIQIPTYRATAEIVFSSTPSPLNTNGNTVSLDPARDIQTQITVLTSAPVRKMVASALQVGTAPSVAATPAPNANAIEVTATSTDPVVAARVANAYSNAYISFRKSSSVNDLLDAEQLIQGRITDLQVQIDALTSQVNAAKPSDQATVQASLGPQRDALFAQQTSLKQQLDQTQLQSALASNGAQIGSPAGVPSSPTGASSTSVGIGALALGVLIGVAIAFLVDFLDDSIKSREDVSQSTQALPALGLVPRVPGWKARKGETRVVSLTAPTSQSAEAYRALRTALEFTTMDHSIRVLQVTSPSADEGKSTTVANLTVALARAGHRVCVVGADLRRPRIHEFFHIPNDRGWISVVQGQRPLSAVLRPIGEVSGAWILTSGTPPADPSEVLGSSRLPGLLTSLAAQFDIVLIDSAPILPVTDAAVLARRVDGVVVVVRGGRTKKRALSRATELLRQIEAPLIGVVFNCVDSELAGGYGYGYGYGYESDPPFGAGDELDPPVIGLSTQDAVSDRRTVRPSGPTR